MNMKKTVKTTIIIALMTTVSGCASMVGVGDDDFGCKGLPGKARCMSPDQIYKASDSDVFTPSATHEKGEKTKPAATPSLKLTKTNNSYILPGAGTPVPVRTPSEVMRIWIAPWEDETGDLTMESLVYTEINKRRWVVGEKLGDAATASSFFRVETQKQAGQKKSSDTLANIQKK